MKKSNLKKVTAVISKENKRLEKRMNEIESDKKVVIKIPTVFYEKILEKSKLNKVNPDLSQYINQLIAFDLGK